MRKIFIFLIIAPSLLLYSLFCLASKARIEALGGEETAQYYFDDTRNIFQNPAHINIMKNYLVLEWGQDYDVSHNDSSSPNAEGGFFNSGDYFNYGLYFGHEDSFEFREEATGNTPNFLHQENAFEVFLGGNFGIQWGASIKGTYSDDEQTLIRRTQSSLVIKFGAYSGPLEWYLALYLFDKSKGGASQGEQYKGDLGPLAGVNYYYKDFVFYAKTYKLGYTYYRPEDGIIDVEYSEQMIKLGGGEFFQLNEKAKMYIDIHYFRLFKEKDTNVAWARINKGKTTYVETIKWNVPITFGIEVMAKDWLTLRGHLTQDIISRDINSVGHKKTQRNTTTVGAGASLIFGKLQLDGLIGMVDTSGNTSKKGVLSMANILTQVSMVYSF